MHHVHLPPRGALVALAFVIAACTQAAPSSPPPATATPSASPSTLPAASTGPSPSPDATASAAPTATPGPTASPPVATSSAGDLVIAAFLANFAAAQPPFHLVSDIEGRFASGTRTGEITVAIEGDVAADDFAGTYHAELPDETQDADLVLLDGVAYLRRPDAEWEIVPGFRQTQPLNPFILLQPSDLTYQGEVTRTGTTLHQLRTTRWVGDDVVLEGVPDAALESSVFDIFVTDEGIPVAAELRFAVVGTTLTGEDARFEYTVLYEFSDVGEPVTIRAPIPIVFPAPSPSASP
jgi:hypothetical protein